MIGNANISSPVTIGDKAALCCDKSTKMKPLIKQQDYSV